MNTFMQFVLIASMVCTASAINCYICNSLTKPECADNFTSFLKVCPVKSFGGQKAVKPLGCRVTRQYVKDEVSIVRECAYTGEDVNDKSNKGSLGVSRTYSQCSKPACNSSTAYSTFLPILIISVMTIFTKFF